MGAAREADARLAAELGSCDVSDACDRLGIGAVRTGLLRPLWPRCPAVAGGLRTVRLEPSANAPSPLPGLLALLAEADGAIVLVDLGGRRDVQCWGSALATAAGRFGVRGALVHGAARDVGALEALAFPTYALGAYPGAAGGRLRLAAVGEPVVLEDGTVEAGGFVVADASGAVFLSADRAAGALSSAADARAREREQLRAVEAGADPREALRPEESS